MFVLIFVDFVSSVYVAYTTLNK